MRAAIIIEMLWNLLSSRRCRRKLRSLRVKNSKTTAISVCRNAVLIESSGRFKRFSDAKEYIRIEAGEGHFKWKRGELPFSAGDLFFADALEEYDFYGTGIFLIVKAQS